MFLLLINFLKASHSFRNRLLLFSFFFFNDTATTEISPLSLPDALPISSSACRPCSSRCSAAGATAASGGSISPAALLSWIAGSPVDRVSDADVDAAAAFLSAVHARSEEHTSELQSRSDLVCRLLLEKKK